MGVVKGHGGVGAATNTCPVAFGRVMALREEEERRGEERREIDEQQGWEGAGGASECGGREVLKWGRR